MCTTQRIRYLTKNIYIKLFTQCAICFLLDSFMREQEEQWIDFIGDMRGGGCHHFKHNHFCLIDISPMLKMVFSTKNYHKYTELSRNGSSASLLIKLEEYIARSTVNIIKIIAYQNELGSVKYVQYGCLNYKRYKHPILTSDAI